MLSEKNLVSIKKLNVGSTNNVLKHVILGKADAGAVLDSFLVKEPSTLSDQIRVIFTTEPISPHPLSAHPRIPPDVRENVSTSILNIDKDATGHALLQTIQIPDPILVNCELDYKNLENLDLDSLSREELVPSR